MNIKVQYTEFRENLINEIRKMVKTLYLKTYGKEPNFDDDETYYLDLSDVSYKRDCKIYVDIYNTIDEIEITEKQKIEYIHIDNDGYIEFETEVNTLSATTIHTDDLMGIYEFFRKVLDELVETY